MLWKLLDKSWQKQLESQKNESYFQDLENFIKNEYQTQTIYPAKKDIFNALNATPFDDIKVVIIGQDPYHGQGQAHGLCFSVMPDTKVPPSLRNIYKELHEDMGLDTPNHGHLQNWANQGVLLLNNVLTVRESSAGSHHKKGWEKFTDKIIEVINEKREGVVFLLWGSPAQKKAQKVDESKHCVLKAVHPSPLSAYRGFFGCKHFSKANAYLKSQGKSEINWQV